MLVGESSVPQSLVQPGVTRTKLGGEGRGSPGQISREGARSISPSISTHRVGHSSVTLGTDTQRHGRPVCGTGSVSALGWWRQPYMPCAAHTGAVAKTGLACLAPLNWSRSAPSESGTLAEVWTDL